MLHSIAAILQGNFLIALECHVHCQTTWYVWQLLLQGTAYGLVPSHLQGGLCVN